MNGKGRTLNTWNTIENEKLTKDFLAKSSGSYSICLKNLKGSFSDVWFDLEIGIVDKNLDDYVRKSQFPPLKTKVADFT